MGAKASRVTIPGIKENNRTERSSTEASARTDSSGIRTAYDTSISKTGRVSHVPQASSNLSSTAYTANSDKARQLDPDIKQTTQSSQALPTITQPIISLQKDLPAMTVPATVPCQYRTGRTLGSGTYAIVKEAIHIKTGKYYACKVINKKLMEGREYMVRNEIAVLKRVSKGHKNIVTLHDYFETTHNLYLCFDLCTGGELFDRICTKGNYYEADAAHLIRTIFKAVEYIHSCGIVHRDLKPENLLFRTKAEDADIMIADFGLSRIMEEEKLKLLTEICGTPGYMAPEIFKKSGHSKPVDVWAMGVITYFLLCGYTPFDRDTQEQEMKAIIAGDYKFEPEEYWMNVSQTARDFVRYCLTVDPKTRPTATEALQHKWLASEQPHFVPDPESATGGPTDLLPGIQKHFNAKKTFRKAVLGMVAMKRLTMLGSYANVDAHKIASDVRQYKEDSEKEHIDEEKSIIHHHNINGDISEEDSEEEQRLKAMDDISSGDVAQNGALSEALKNAKISQNQILEEKSSEDIDRTGV